MGVKDMVSELDFKQLAMAAGVSALLGSGTGIGTSSLTNAELERRFTIIECKLEIAPECRRERPSEAEGD